MASEAATERGKGSAREAKKKLRVFFIPFFASGHIIPMADLAWLFAASHDAVEPTLVLTPANAEIVRPSLHPSARLLLYPFPAAEVGLPPGLENLASVPSDDTAKVHQAARICREPQEALLRRHRPDAVVSDIHFWWTAPIARDLGIPRLTFMAGSIFAACVINSLIQDSVALDESGPETVPGLPGPPIRRIPLSELPVSVRHRDEPEWQEWWKALTEGMRTGYGAVVNNFYEMESAYCDQFRVEHSPRSWFVGPVALARGGGAAERGGAGAENRSRCLEWLEGKEKGSVVLVCFGSWCFFSGEQLREMAAGLEGSGQPFLWVVRGFTKEGGGESWMAEGWEKRVEGRGLVVRGWVPQVEILGHAAVGAFLTHCGSNSVLEAASAGVPMLTWPLAFDHFICERLVVDVMGAGRRVWGGFRSTKVEENVVVPGEAIARAVSRFMEGGEGAAAKARAREYAAMARGAVAEGGASWTDLRRLIDELFALQSQHKSYQ